MCGDGGGLVKFWWSSSPLSGILVGWWRFGVFEWYFNGIFNEFY